MGVLQISPENAWEVLKEKSNSILIDVRTEEELNFVGGVDLSSIESISILIPWRVYPTNKVNESFKDQLFSFIEANFSNNSPQEINLLFLCRSGFRSLEAAEYISAFNYNCYNIINGFEGSVDSAGFRGTIDGWKAKNLPWKYN